MKLLEDILSDNADLIHAGEGIAEDGGSGRGGGVPKTKQEKALLQNEELQIIENALAERSHKAKDEIWNIHT